MAIGNPCKVLREINEQDEQFYFKGRRIVREDLV
ncbi:acetyltransferase-like isoleucine patch superfamily enzyme [Paenibacillus sp. PastF-1]|nr:acetyltransferase-like isoleucine patch superfamily enzyme [Paenibacillus sp. PastF-1]